MQIPITLVYEDELSGSCIRKILNTLGNKFIICESYNKGGYGYIKKNINAFINASKANPFLVLTDLDNYSCPLDLIRKWIKKPTNSNFIFRIAVTEVESWLLSDKEGFSDYFNVSINLIPTESEKDKNPKKTLIDIVKKSKIREFREDIIPLKHARVGPNYNNRLNDFVSNHWSIERAIKNNNSLQRAYNHLNLFTYTC